MTSPVPPWPVRWPVMYQTWSWLAFLHWSYEPAVVQRLPPASLRVHAFDGRAWVGVTPFLLEDLRTPVAPAPPWFTSFPETNVRTYVRGPDGREGLWFFSLDAARLEPVLVARSTYRLPYMWSRMTVERDGPVVRELQGNLVVAAGLPAPEGDVVVHWSPGVRTRISALRSLGHSR